jgi:hypothetical protein
MLRPLYLEGTTPWQVRLDGGVALRIAAPGRAARNVPLQQVARVVCDARVHWDSEALLACLRAGVPVVFHDARGDPVGWCFGPRRRETTLANLLQEALTQLDWPERWAQWHAAVQRREMHHALRAAQVHVVRLDAAAVRARLCNLHHQRIDMAAGELLCALRCAATALVAERVHSQVGDAALLCWARPGLHLPAELAALLEWRLHGLLHATPAAQLRAMAATRVAATLVERHVVGLEAAIGEMLGELELHLREWLL